MYTPSPLQTIYAQRTIGLDSDVLRDLVPFVQSKKCEKHPWRGVLLSVKLLAKCFTKSNTKHHIRIYYQSVRIEKQLAATFLGNLRSTVT